MRRVPNLLAICEAWAGSDPGLPPFFRGVAATTERYLLRPAEGAGHPDSRRLVVAGAESRERHCHFDRKCQQWQQDYGMNP
jgi:hypothetical protein